MEKSEFLAKISSLNREEIQNQIKNKERIKKKICPAVYIINRDKNPTSGKKKGK